MIYIIFNLKHTVLFACPEMNPKRQPEGPGELGALFLLLLLSFSNKFEKDGMGVLYNFAVFDDIGIK